MSGSAVAAVLAAKLASTLGVYGTILGAGVISVIATCGGPVLQHLFKRTGEQMREAATVSARPQAPQAPARHQGAAPGEEFGAPTTHGTRVRVLKRSALGAAVVFVLAMGGITAYELTSGQDLSGTKGTTTFGTAVGGHGAGQGGERSSRKDAPDSTPSDGGQRERTDGGSPTPGSTPGTGTATPDGTTTPTPPVTPTPSTEPPASTGPSGGGSTPPTTPPATPPPAPPTAQAPTGNAAE
ncbi:hypothetical protein ACIGEZ_15225 [Streptomyces sp. NPDC085481]|uniref:hypothetical protein n=1 Tax=Streptomyces sp. NPDC085481 TaxID=3365727 RepID=UPI0037D75040